MGEGHEKCKCNAHVMKISKDKAIKQKYLKYNKCLKYCVCKQLNGEAIALNIDTYLLFGRIFWEILEPTYKCEPTRKYRSVCWKETGITGGGTE